jgi:hypothetical protein
VADVLSSGDPPRVPSRRRGVTIAGTVLLAAAAVLLAARSAPGRPDAAPLPTPRPVEVVRGSGPGVVSVAVGTRWAYALVAECDPGAARACGYRLHRRPVDGSGGWAALPLVTETRTTVGVVPTLAVSGADVVTVLEQSTSGRVYSSAAGVGASQHQLARGRPIDVVPAAGLLDSAVCDTCRERLVALEPDTGLLRPLRNQPFPGAGVRAYTMRGDTAWAVSTTSAATTSAVSLDRGRSWRTVPVPGLAPDIDTLQLATGAGGDAYLLCSTTGTNGTSRLAGVWAISGPAGKWERMPGPIPRTVRSALVGERGLLVTDPGGTVWRLERDGAFAALPDAGPTRPGFVTTGPGRILAAVPRGRIPDPLVLTSSDGGESWQTERIG